MSHPSHLGLQLLGFGACVLLAICTLATDSYSQGNSPKPSEECSSYTSVPLPPEAETTPAPEVYPACASYRSYAGIGRARNYSEARACAWQERLAQKAELRQNPKEPRAWFVGGSLILADIYFNGAGVKRNIPLAMRFACESEEGMADLALPDIEKLHGSTPAHKPFEFCDYAVTTFTMNFCAGYDSEIGDDRRSHYYRSIEASMDVNQQRSFEKLLLAQNAYITAHASEVYQGGTIRNIRTIGSQNILKDLFRTELVHFERHKWPALSERQIQTADGLLRSEYQKIRQSIRARTADEIEDGVVTAEHLSSVETIWGAYRDAWVAFAKVRYPAGVPAIRAQITLDRYRLLKTIS